MESHRYETKVKWTGNCGDGTPNYRGYDRSHEICSPGKPTLLGSSDPAFLGDPARYNPEELLVASLSSCHMLWYLHLCSSNGISVQAYEDNATGVMEVDGEGSGRFTEVCLAPVVKVLPGADVELVQLLHDKAHRLCFIANSVSFPIRHLSVVEVVGDSQ